MSKSQLQKIAKKQKSKSNKMKPIHSSENCTMTMSLEKTNFEMEKPVRIVFALLPILAIFLMLRIRTEANDQGVHEHDRHYSYNLPKS